MMKILRISFGAILILLLSSCANLNTPLNTVEYMVDNINKIYNNEEIDYESICNKYAYDVYLDNDCVNDFNDYESNRDLLLPYYIMEYEIISTNVTVLFEEDIDSLNIAFNKEYTKIYKIEYTLLNIFQENDTDTPTETETSHIAYMVNFGGKYRIIGQE